MGLYIPTEVYLFEGTLVLNSILALVIQIIYNIIYYPCTLQPYNTLLELIVFANSPEPGQPAHSCSLIRFYTVDTQN